jgi:hypothetical protein
MFLLNNTEDPEKVTQSGALRVFRASAFINQKAVAVAKRGREDDNARIRSYPYLLSR